MPTIEERIADLEDRLAQTKPNKHTMKSIVTIKADLAGLRRELVQRLSNKAGGHAGFGVRKTGDAQAALIGYPSVGKSTLLNQLTSGRTDSKVAAYDFTTLDCVPGMMVHDKISVQLLDLPGIILGASQGRGRGREILSMLRAIDIIITILSFDDEGNIDAGKLKIIQQELQNIGIRVNKRPPRVSIKRVPKGGIMITKATKLTHLDGDLVKAICNEYKITNAHVVFYENATADDLIDVILGNCVYIPSIIVVNKVDIAKPDNLASLPSILGTKDFITVSGNTGYNIDNFKDLIIQRLDLMKVYLKPKGKDADMEKPLIIKRASTVEDVCRKIHKDFVKSFRFAKVWGKSAKHPGQVVHLGHVLEDSDLLSIFLKT
nr:GTP-binding protein [Candidatus Sigynarchaeota archaeon]